MAVRWYLAHGQTLVYVEKGTWYLVVMTRCKYLSRDDRCRIYLSRPKICQEYTTDDCEYDENWTYPQYFETPEQFDEYCEAIGRPSTVKGAPQRRGIRSPRPVGLPML